MIKGLLKDAALLWYQKDGPRLAAALSYYAIFVLAPLLFTLITLASVVLPGVVVGSVLTLWGDAILGQGLTDVLMNAVDSIGGTANAFVAPTIGLVFLTAVSVVGLNELISGLHDIWGVPSQGTRGFVKKSIFSVVLIPLLAVLLVGAVVVTAFLTFTNTVIATTDVLPAGLAVLVHTIVSLILLTVLFTLLYRLPPQIPVRWGSAFRGGFIAAILFMVVKVLMELYVTLNPIPGIYGAASSLIVLLLWIYVGGMVFYYGAAFARAYATRYEIDTI